MIAELISELKNIEDNSVPREFCEKWIRKLNESTAIDDTVRNQAVEILRKTQISVFGKPHGSSGPKIDVYSADTAAMKLSLLL